MDCTAVVNHDWRHPFFLAASLGNIWELNKSNLPPLVREAITRVKNGESYLGWILWQPLMMEAWRRHFLYALGKKPRVSVHAQA